MKLNLQFMVQAKMKKKKKNLLHLRDAGHLLAFKTIGNVIPKDNISQKYPPYDQKIETRERVKCVKYINSRPKEKQKIEIIYNFRN